MPLPTRRHHGARIQVNDDVRPRKTLPQGLFHLIGQPVRLAQRQRVLHLQMQLDETRRPD